MSSEASKHDNPIEDNSRRDFLKSVAITSAMGSAGLLTPPALAAKAQQAQRDWKCVPFLRYRLWNHGCYQR